jgi:hypothetical protein
MTTIETKYRRRDEGIVSQVFLKPPFHAQETDLNYLGQDQVGEYGRLLICQSTICRTPTSR